MHALLWNVSSGTSGVSYGTEVDAVAAAFHPSARAEWECVQGIYLSVLITLRWNFRETAATIKLTRVSAFTFHFSSNRFLRRHRPVLFVNVWLFFRPPYLLFDSICLTAVIALATVAYVLRQPLTCVSSITAAFLGLRFFFLPLLGHFFFFKSVIPNIDWLLSLVWSMTRGSALSEPQKCQWDADMWRSKTPTWTPSSGNSTSKVSQIYFHLTI